MFKNIIVLIDAENIAAKYFPGVYDKIATLGNIGSCKIYGDWKQPSLTSWQPMILKYTMEAIHQFACVKGKNATDIALVIGAMDCLHSGDVDCFCLISSDSDFSGLAQRIRKGGIKIYGFGKSMAADLFKQAYDDFFVLEELAPELKNSTTPAVSATPPAVSNDSKQYTILQLQADKYLVNALNEIIPDDKQWISAGRIGCFLSNNYPSITKQKYGYGKLIDLLAATQLYRMQKIGSGWWFCRKCESKPLIPYTRKQLLADSQLTQALDGVLLKDSDAWIDGGAIGNYLRDHFPKFSLKNYGYGKLTQLLSAMGIYQVRQNDHKSYEFRRNPPLRINIAKSSNQTSENLCNALLTLWHKRAVRGSARTTAKYIAAHQPILS